MDMYHQTLTIEELKEQIERSKRKEGRKGRTLDPVTVGHNRRKICSSWWGQAWCENLERYADYENRIPRAKRYLRSGAVIDLKIHKGEIEALVQGSRRTPYKVRIEITPFNDRQIKEFQKLLGNQIENLEALVRGDFPEALKEKLFEKGGLFPEPRQIHFGCSCPDWAYMCKHIGAVLYGIGLRLDENPLYFFELRGIDPSDFIRRTAQNKIEAMLEHADTPTERAIRDESLVSQIFALE